MWKLTIEDDEQKQIALPLVQATYGIGRDEVNEIRLTERNISRKHAVLKQNGQGWVVQDLDSYNGTFVNGLRVAGEQHVGNGDILQLGDYRIEFVDETKSVPLQPASPTTTQQMAQFQRPDRLVVVVGPQPGQEFFLDREHFTLGRSEDANVSVNHSSVSRFHAELFAVGNGRYEIIDKGSANGIRINGQEVRRGFIEAGDALELGDVRLRFVGAGKIFRAGFDRSQALPAVTGFDRSAPKKPSGSNVLTLVAVGALLGIVGVGAAAAYVATRDDAQPAPSSTPTASSDESSTDRAILMEAKQLREQGDLAGAHELISKIPLESAVLRDPLVAEIEGAWADILFGKADQTEDEQTKVELLWKIATTPTVDEGRRRKASAKLKEVGVEVPEDPKLLRPNAPLPANYIPRPRPTASSSARPSGSIDRQALDKPRDKLSELQGRFGSLTVQELRLLMGLCQQEGNLKCAQDAAKRQAELLSGGSASAAPSAKAPGKK